MPFGAAATAAAANRRPLFGDSRTSPAPIAPARAGNRAAAPAHSRTTAAGAANSWSKLARNCVIIAPRCGGGIARAGLPARHARRDGSMRFGARPARRPALPSAASGRSDATNPRAGSADEQFLHRHRSLSDHRHRRAVRRPLFHRLERLSRRVRGGGHAPAGPRGQGRRRGQPAPAADPLFPLREGAHRRHVRQPPGAVFPHRQPDHQARHPADDQGRGGGQRDRAAAAGAAPGAQQRDGWNWQSFGQVLGKSAYLPAQRRADVGQDRRRRAGAARARRRGAHALRGLQRRALGARARRPLPLARHLRQGPRRARAEACHGAARARRLRALQGHPAGRRRRLDLHAGRPPRRPDGQAARRRRAHRAAADRRAVAGAPTRQRATQRPERRRGRPDRASPRST